MAEVALRPAASLPAPDAAGETAAETAGRTRTPAVEEALVVPPLNFAMVAPGVYRSGYPNKRNFPFLRRLGLKSIMYLATEDYSDENLAFLNGSNITIFRYKLQGNKEPFVELPQSEIASALVHVLDKRNHPILVHCNKGKHRAGCLVGCLRKLQHWSLISIFDEYQRFAGKTVRIADQQFIELFDHAIPYDAAHKPDWL